MPIFTRYSFKSVLVVDNSEFDRFIFIKANKASKFAENLEILHSAPAALDFIKARDRNSLPKLILLDLHMPEMDGLAFLNHFKALPEETRKIPIVLMSGIVFPHLSEEYRQHTDARFFVEKPITSAKLAQIVKLFR